MINSTLLLELPYAGQNIGWPLAAREQLVAPVSECCFFDELPQCQHERQSEQQQQREQHQWRGLLIPGKTVTCRKPFRHEACIKRAKGKRQSRVFRGGSSNGSGEDSINTQPYITGHVPAVTAAPMWEKTRAGHAHHPPTATEGGLNGVR